MTRPNHAPQQTRRGRGRCSHCVPCAGSHELTHNAKTGGNHHPDNANKVESCLGCNPSKPRLITQSIRLLAYAMIFAFTFLVACQTHEVLHGDASGEIVDWQERPIRGVRITSKNGDLLAISDQEGTFSTPMNSKNGTAINLSKLGYQPLQATIFNTRATNIYKLRRDLSDEVLSASVHTNDNLLPPDLAQELLFSVRIDSKQHWGWLFLNRHTITNSISNVITSRNTMVQVVPIFAALGFKKELMLWVKNASSWDLNANGYGFRIVAGALCNPESEEEWDFLRRCLRGEFGSSAFTSACHALTVSSNGRALNELENCYKSKYSKNGVSESDGIFLLKTIETLKSRSPLINKNQTAEAAAVAALNLIFLDQSIGLKLLSKWEDISRKQDLFVYGVAQGNHFSTVLLTLQLVNGRWQMQSYQLLTIS